MNAVQSLWRFFKPPLAFITLTAVLVFSLTACDPSASQNGAKKLSGHNGWVNSIAWSPDSKMLISGALDTTARVWDVEKGTEIKTLTGFHGSVMKAAWSPDGKYVVTVSAEPTDNLRIWDATTWTVIRKWTQKENLGDFAWAPDGTKFALGISTDSWADPFYDRLVTYTVGSWAETAIFTSTRGINYLAWSPDSQQLAFKQSREVIDSAIMQVEVPTFVDNTAQSEPKTLVVLPDVMTSLAWSVDGKYLATSRSPQDIEVWDAKSGDKIAAFTEHTQTIIKVAWSPTGDLLASGGYDRTARVWSVSEKKSVQTIKHPDVVMDVAWSPDGKYLATACADRNIYIWPTDSLSSDAP
jgi:WD40 repeat protein